MAEYDYRAGKKRVEDILRNKLLVINSDTIPNEKNFTFLNGYYGWVTAIFVDIRDSTELFDIDENDREKISKIIRSFTSEVIEILRKDDNLREIGIRGDCVYAIYTTATKNSIWECFYQACTVSTYLKMLNKLLEESAYPTILAGIGIASSKELVVKAGRKDVDINNLVWIGKAVTRAANLSALGNDSKHWPIVLSNTTYVNVVEEIGKEKFSEKYDKNFVKYYDCNLVINTFDDWINGGMSD